MAHSNSTQYYNLPQFDSTDKPAWLVDVNPAYSAIDTGIHAAKVAADAAQIDATQALSDAGTAGTAASAADTKASGAVASIARAFDETATYDIGDKVVYNNLMYDCIVAVTVPGPWTASTNWNRIYIGDELNTKMDHINDLTAAADGTVASSDKVPVLHDGTEYKASLLDGFIACNDFTSNTEKLVGTATINGRVKKIYRYIVEVTTSVKSWTTYVSNLPFDAANIIKADFNVKAGSAYHNTFSSYYKDTTDKFRAGFSSIDGITILEGELGSSYPATPATVYATAYYYKD